MHSGVGIISHYFSGLTTKQKEQFENLLPLYNEWNQKINVISRKDIDQLYERHVLHSLGIAKVISFADGASVIDAGTGGGFPGIPLAIFFPEVKFHLVDSIGKKIKVVNEISSALGLKNVTAEQERAENIKGKFDYAVSRAVAPLAEMMQWLRPMIKRRSADATIYDATPGSLPNGFLFLKGGDLEEEIAQLKEKVKVFELKDFFEEEFFGEKKVLYVAKA
jgi:16S rRNA (guanine527-N7)-methyltransferase